MGLISVDYGDKGKRRLEQPDSVDCLEREIARLTFLSCQNLTVFNTFSGASTAAAVQRAAAVGRWLPFLNVQDLFF